MKFIGNVSEAGVLTIVNRKGFDEYVKEFCGKQVSIVIEKHIHKRSLSQNAYYHGCIIPIVRQGFKDLGHLLSNDETHLFLKNRFLKVELISEDGEVLGERIKSTTELTKGEFIEYINQIQQFGAEILNVYIPDANEQVKLINQN
jgi:hypothetical protein